MKYLVGYKIRLEPRKFSKLMSLWYKIKATILRKTVTIERVIIVQVDINGEPIINRELEVRGVPGGMVVDYPTPFLVRDTDTVKLKVQNMSGTAKAKVELILVDPKERSFSLYRDKTKEGAVG